MSSASVGGIINIGKWSNPVAFSLTHQLVVSVITVLNKLSTRFDDNSHVVVCCVSLWSGYQSTVCHGGVFSWTQQWLPRKDCRYSTLAYIFEIATVFHRVSAST